MHAISLPDEFHVLFLVGMMFVISQLAGRLAHKLNLPSLIGYLAAGIIAGPYVLEWYDEELITKDLAFFRDFALSIVAFSIGAELNLKELKPIRAGLEYITLFQSGLASLFVFIAMLLVLPFTLGDVNFVLAPLICLALLFGALSGATAPAAILDLCDEYKAKGRFKTMLLGIVAIDDVIVVIVYSIVLAFVGVILGMNSEHWHETIGRTGMTLMTEIGLGVLIGFVTAKVLSIFPEHRNMLGLMFGIVMATCGLCLSLGMSPLLTNMMLGAMITNLAKHERADEAIDTIHYIQTPVFSVFFFMAGAHLNPSLVLMALGPAVALTLARFAGKYWGAVIGGKVSKTDPHLSNNVGLALLPAAGVMVGLALHTKDNVNGMFEPYAEILVSTVIAATLINEFLTPFFVRFAIKRSKQQEAANKESSK